jgi:hypothetical protein
LPRNSREGRGCCGLETEENSAGKRKEEEPEENLRERKDRRKNSR